MIDDIGTVTTEEHENNIIKRNAELKSIYLALHGLTDNSTLANWQSDKIIIDKLSNESDKLVKLLNVLYSNLHINSLF